MVITTSRVALGLVCIAATATATPRSLFGNSNHAPVQEGWSDPSKPGDMVYHLNKTTGYCGDTKMTSGYMTTKARTKLFIQKGIEYSTKAGMVLHDGSCQDVGYTKQVGTTTYKYSYHVYTVKVWAKGKRGNHCEDKPGFTDEYAPLGCSDYVDNKWCANGKTGSGWKKSWGKLTGAATEMCCACGGGAAGGAAPVAASKKSCSFQGATTGHGETYEGPTHTCTCADGKWVTCVKISDSVVVPDDDSSSD